VKGPYPFGPKAAIYAALGDADLRAALRDCLATLRAVDPLSADHGWYCDDACTIRQEIARRAERRTCAACGR